MDEPDDQENLYRIQLLQAFDIEQWDDTEINSLIQELLIIILSSEDFHAILNKAKKNANFIEVITNAGFTINDDDITFKMLFIYEYFDLMHWCLCDYLRDGCIKQSHLDNIINALEH